MLHYPDSYVALSMDGNTCLRSSTKETFMKKPLLFDFSEIYTEKLHQ